MKAGVRPTVESVERSVGLSVNRSANAPYRVPVPPKARVRTRADGAPTKARSAFDKAIAMAPKDEDWQAEVGAYYNLQGDREKAEELFQRSFSSGLLVGVAWLAPARVVASTIGGLP